jgi:hypothetical protein
MHTLINTRTAHPTPPLRGILSQELNGVGWPVPFPLRTAHNQVTMKCIEQDNKTADIVPRSRNAWSYTPPIRLHGVVLS